MRTAFFTAATIAICAYRPEWIWQETTPWPVVFMCTLGLVAALVLDGLEAAAKIQKLLTSGESN